eukprot:2566398-Alexandrium_andersonii.AAC.1
MNTPHVYAEGLKERASADICAASIKAAANTLAARKQFESDRPKGMYTQKNCLRRVDVLRKNGSRSADDGRADSCET